MFSRISRYRALPDVAVEDADGRVVASKSLRLLPEAREGLLHVVEKGDRLDHLAFKYYKQPREWWKIADANPDFLSPLALLGNEPRSTVVVPVTWDGPEPPWSALVSALTATPGVDDADTGSSGLPVPEVSYRETAEVVVVTGAGIPAPLIALADFLRTGGEVGPSLPLAELVTNLQTVVPSLADPVSLVSIESHRWRVREDTTGLVLDFHLTQPAGVDTLRVTEVEARWDWVLSLVHDPVVAPIETLLALMAGQLFGTGSPAPIVREGKRIVVPPRGA